MDVEIELEIRATDDHVNQLQERIEELESENQLLKSRVNTLADNQAIILELIGATQKNISIKGNVIRIKVNP